MADEGTSKESPIDRQIIEDIRRKLLALTDEQRVEVLHKIGFCLHCGTDVVDPSKLADAWNAHRDCHCWNDE